MADDRRTKLNAHPFPEHTTSRPPRLRLLAGGASSAAASEKARWYTIADVAKACGLPQPVVAQLVPRTWTKDGWMYTGAQRLHAIEIAKEIRSQSG